MEMSLNAPDLLSRRSLFYIPIIHTQADMGALGASLHRIKASTFGQKSLRRSAEAVDKMWEDIEHAVESMAVEPGKTRVYQHGLPVCGHESRIVADLAEAGSRNHKLLVGLERKGAVLMGTESPELLLEEYQLAAAALNSRGPGGASRRQLLSSALLEKRDRFIAGRINTTLGVGESGILFIGMLHEVRRFLQQNIEISYPVQAL